MERHRTIATNRRDEYDALVALLTAEASVDDAEARDVAEWIASAALEDGHLWKAMGLQQRAELRSVIERHFPALAAANDRDMRWKKFLYKRLCGWPGFSG